MAGLTLLATGFCLVGCISAAKKHGQLGVRAIQGGWWLTCEEPTAEFVVVGVTYISELRGERKLRVVAGEMLITDDEETSPMWIIEASPDRLVLRIEAGDDIVLRQCPSSLYPSPSQMSISPMPPCSNGIERHLQTHRH